MQALNGRIAAEAAEHAAERRHAEETEAAAEDARRRHDEARRAALSALTEDELEATWEAAQHRGLVLQCSDMPADAAERAVMLLAHNADCLRIMDEREARLHPVHPWTVLSWPR